MSLIGRKPIPVPSGVKVNLSGQSVKVEGGKGKLELDLYPGLKINEADNQLEVVNPDNSVEPKFHGLMRSLVNNMVVGVSEGFKKTLDIVGVGYRAKVSSKSLELNIGFCHPVNLSIPEGLNVSCEGNNVIHIEGADKQKVGQFSAEIRAVRPPEPYKGKGIKYRDEVVRRKAGKAVVGGS